MNRRLLVSGLLLAPLGCSHADGAHGEPALRALIAKQAEAWNRHDARAWSEPFLEQADFVNILGMLFEGRAQIEKRHADLFNGIFSKSRVVVTVRKIVSLGATSALVETVHELRDYTRLPPGLQPSDADGALRTRLKYVMTLTGDGWRIASAQNTAIFKLP
jgi:uncharacterized protein (TIGR02246 family)